MHRSIALVYKVDGALARGQVVEWTSLCSPPFSGYIATWGLLPKVFPNIFALVGEPGVQSAKTTPFFFLRCEIFP